MNGECRVHAWMFPWQHMFHGRRYWPCPCPCSFPCHVPVVRQQPGFIDTPSTHFYVGAQPCTSYINDHINYDWVTFSPSYPLSFFVVIVNILIPHLPRATSSSTSDIQYLILQLQQTYAHCRISASEPGTSNMMLRGRSKDPNRKVTPPGPSYMSNDEFGE